MPAISNATPASPSTDDQNSNYALRGWLPVITTMPLLIAVVLFLMCIPRYVFLKYSKLILIQSPNSNIDYTGWLDMAGLQAQKDSVAPRDLHRQNPPVLKTEICFI